MPPETSRLKAVMATSDTLKKDQSLQQVLNTLIDIVNKCCRGEKEVVEPVAAPVVNPPPE